MESPTTIDVLITGAGPAGLALAIDLARRGRTFRLIEKMAEPFHGSRGKGIQPRTQEILEDFGILGRVVALGGIYPPQREHRKDGGFRDSPVFEGNDPTPAEPHQLALMVPQFLTEKVLRERLAELGHRPEFGRELMGFAQDAEAVVARVAGPAGEERVRARFLVGTDGGRSFVRQALAIGFPGKTLDVRGLVADVELTGLDREAWHRFAEGDMKRQVSLCPLAGTAMFQLQAPIPLAGEVDLSADGLTRMIGQRTGRQDIQVHSVSWASAFTMNARLADRYRVGRVFLAGDAAHVHPPTGGQGLNTSIQDAYNLGWKLVAALESAPAELLDSYEEERRPIAADMLGLSTSLLQAMKRGLLRRGRETRQLDLGYASSSLALETRKKGRLRAGQRAPDAPVRDSAGSAVRLFELFAGPHWTLLGNAADAGEIAPHPNLRVHGFGPGGDLVDHAGHFRDAYGLEPGEWVLVRPDGYVGAIVAAEKLGVLDDYRRRVGLLD